MRDERGFTLVELMVVVAVMGVLAKLVIPQFIGESNRGKAKTEVVGVFAELTSKELDYQATKGSFLEAAACPASSTGAQQDLTACSATGGVWAPLKTVMPVTVAYCSYKVSSGTASQTPMVPSGFSMTAPASTWFFISATCLIGGTTYKYFTSSVDTSIQSQ